MSRSSSKTITNDKKQLVNLKDVKPTGGKINLVKSGITSLDWLGHQPKLEYLDLSDNFISSFESFGLYFNLKSLDLSFNEISSLDGMREMPNLKFLNLSGNQLTELSGLPQQPELEQLIVSSNALETLSGMIYQPKLTFLSVSNNALSSIQGVPAMDTLTGVNLSGNKICETVSMYDVFALLVFGQNLQFLDGREVDGIARAVSLGYGHIVSIAFREGMEFEEIGSAEESVGQATEYLLNMERQIHSGMKFELESAHLDGVAVVGATLTGCYVFVPSTGSMDQEIKMQYQWYRLDSSGTMRIIIGETGKSYEVGEEDIGYALVVEGTPVGNKKDMAGYCSRLISANVDLDIDEEDEEEQVEIE